MTPLTGLIILITLLLVIAIIFNQYRVELKRNAENQKAAVELGFLPIKEVDPELVQQIFQFHPIHQKSKGQILGIRNAFQRSEKDFTLYMFDLLDFRGDIVNHLADGAIAVVSPALHLPRFSIYPKMGDQRRVSGLADALLEKMALANMNQIVLEANPYFEQNYILVSEDEQEVREFFSNSSLSVFTEQKSWQIEAGGDLFTVASLHSRPKIGRKSPVDPRSIVQEAMGLFDTFKSSSPFPEAKGAEHSG